MSQNCLVVQRELVGVLVLPHVSAMRFLDSPEQVQCSSCEQVASVQVVKKMLSVLLGANGLVHAYGQLQCRGPRGHG